MNAYDDHAGSGRHPLSTGYLVAGLVFLGIATSWALRAADVIDDEGSRWILPVVLIVAGLAGLVAWLVRSAGARNGSASEPEDLPFLDGTADDPDRGADPLAR